MSITSSPRFDLLLLTGAAGIMDALSYLASGVFTANMTGNTVILGLAISGSHRSNLLPCVTSLTAFLFGALIAAIVLVRHAQEGDNSANNLKTGIALELPFALVFALLSWISREHTGFWIRLLLISSAACALGVQSVAVRKLKVAGVVTTFITGTITTAIVSLVGKEEAGDTEEQTEINSPMVLAEMFFLYVVAAAATAVLVWQQFGNIAALAPVILLAVVYVRVTSAPH